MKMETSKSYKNRAYYYMPAKSVIRGYSHHVRKGNYTWEEAIRRSWKRLDDVEVAIVLEVIESILHPSPPPKLLDLDQEVSKTQLGPAKRRVIRKGEFPGQHT